MLIYVSSGLEEEAIEYEDEPYSSFIDAVGETFKLKEDSFILKDLNEDNFYEIIGVRDSFEIGRSEKDKALERLDGKTSFKDIDNVEDVENFLLVYGFSEDVDGNTPLSWAAYNGHLEIVKVLLENGATQEAGKNGYTPIYRATCYGHLKVVKVLNQYGAK